MVSLEKLSLMRFEARIPRPSSDYDWEQDLVLSVS